MSEKKLQIEDRNDWPLEYGNFSAIYPNIKNFINFLEKFKSLKKEKIRILEYGCALGYYLKVLQHDNPMAELYGVDIANKAIESSIYNTGIPRSRFFWQSCDQTLPMKEGFFDLIYGLDVIEHVEKDEEVEAWFKETRRLLKPDGVFVIIAPNCNWIMRRIYDIIGQSWIYKGTAHKRYFSRKKIAKWAEKYFKVIYKGLYNHRPKPHKKILKLLGISKHLAVVLTK